MKRFLLLILVSLMVEYAWSQRILVADNTPSAPSGSHIFSSLQEAIDASMPGDIIHVKPSASAYGNITITAANDSISIYGIGFNPIKEISQISTINSITVSGFNIRISGFKVTSTVYMSFASGSGNFSFENNIFDGTIYVGYTQSLSNVIFRNNIFYGQIIQSATLTNSTVFNNCVFSYNSTTTAGQIDSRNGTLYSHCLFFGQGGAADRKAFSTCENSTISNSIFFGRSPAGSISVSNTTYNNCYVEGAVVNDFPTGNGNSVNGIITSIDGSIFSDPEIVMQQVWNFRWEPTLDPISVQLINGGDNGTDIGLTGGTLPYDYTGTPLPYIESLVIPSVIKRGDNINVKVKAKSN